MSKSTTAGASPRARSGDTTPGNAPNNSPSRSDGSPSTPLRGTPMPARRSKDTMRTPAIALTAVAAASVLLLTGCGTTENAGAADGATAAITIVDDRGESIELAAPAEKVVALEWNTAENLVALGVMPVGVADVEGYGDWVQSETLDESVTDVGMRGEPSVDAIAGLAPELVLTTTDLPEAVITQIEEFAPVLV